MINEKEVGEAIEYFSPAVGRVKDTTSKGFNYYMTTLKAQLNRAELQQPACNHDWQPEWHTDTFITSSAVKKWRCTKCLATTLTND